MSAHNILDEFCYKAGAIGSSWQRKWFQGGSGGIQQHTQQQFLGNILSEVGECYSLLFFSPKE